MKSFRQFLEEAQESPNSRGVLVHGNKIFVGVEHGVKPTFSPEVHNMIQSHMQQHGYYHEGNGGDAKALSGITGNHQYHGSWDDSVDKHLHTDSNGNRFTPYHHLSNLFGNSPEGTQQTVNTLSNNPNTTIRDAIKQNSHKLYPGAPVAPQHVDKFFNEAGQKFSRMADQPATPDNLHAIFKAGRNDCWDENGAEKNTPIGNMASKFNSDREDHILSNKSGPGVYFIGSGHLPSMVSKLRNNGVQSKYIGGSTAHL